jgi:glycosyltransferase involved in cell wall biosynthesis
VAIFQTDLHVGGIQKALINSVCSPVFENTDVEIYLFDDQVFFDISLLPENVSIHFLKPFPFLWRLFPYGVIRHIARPFPISGAFDAAIDFNSYQHTCAFGALSVPAKKRVMWIHNDMEIKLHEEGKYRLLWYAMRGKYPYYTHFAAVSEGIIPAFRRCSSPVDRPIVAIPNLINTDEIWEKAQEPTDIHVDPAKFNIVSVGRLCHQKGFDLMLEDIRKVYEKRPDIACYIIGDGPDRDALKRQAAKLGIQDVVHFTGNLPNPFPVVRQMDAFCLESRYEGQGIVLWEAKSLGLPLYFPRRLEKYNPSLTGTDDLVEALIQAKRTEKKFDPLVEYNQEVCQRLSQLLFD